MANVFEYLRRPTALWWLVGINAVVFVVLTALSFGNRGVAAWLAMPGDIDVWLSRPWTAFTYMVTQVEFLHLLFNMLILLWCGSMMLMVISQAKLVAIYIGGGLCGALFFLLESAIFEETGRTVQPLMGASASVLALMTVAAFLIGNYRLHLFFIGDVKLKWIWVFMLVLEFLSFGGGSAGAGMAHVGGVVFGVVWSLVTLVSKGRRRGQNKPKYKTPTDSGARRVASILEQNRMDKIRLDELLDKIRVSGYDSLSRNERRELDEISRRISK